LRKVIISQKDYERQGTAILKDAVVKLDSDDYEIIVRKKPRKVPKPKKHEEERHPAHPCQKCGEPLRRMPANYRGRSPKCLKCGFQDLRK